MICGSTKMISKGVHISILISYWMGTRETAAADQFNGIAWPTNNFFAPFLPTSVEFLKMMAKLVSQERTIIVGNEMLSLHFPICKKIHINPAICLITTKMACHLRVTVSERKRESQTQMHGISFNSIQFTTNRPPASNKAASMVSKCEQ